MQTTIVYPQRQPNYPPVGALYLADALEKEGIETDLVDSSISNEGLEKLVKRNKRTPINMSVITSPQIADFVRLSKHIKRVSPRTPIIWGGIHPTLNPEQCINENYIDMVVTGPGEEVLPGLVKMFGRGVADISQGGGIINMPSLKRLDDFSPRWDKLGNLDKFVFPEDHSVRHPDSGEGNIFYYLMTSRGCVYNCSFCAVPKISEGRWEGHSSDKVVEQIDNLRSQTNFDGVGIWDDMFWVDSKRADRILGGLKKRNLSYLIEARADQLLRNKSKLLNKLKDTDCLQVFVGAESGNQETLDYLNKRTKVTDYLTLAESAKELKLPVRFSLIMGFPYESDKSVQDTLKLSNKLKNNPYTSVSGPKLFTPYPGTKEYYRAVENGLQIPTTTEEWSHIHRHTDNYLERFPWLKKNLSTGTLSKMEDDLRK